ncbi:outer membrane protein [Helicobacter mehlei]|uniref:Outer membrane protein n=1 Tax=Helicobacter mehlei TaxID=2316080 RepID=A0A553UUM9_9HELI|nr:outer membrane protein [Helicobacter mehlei]TSA83920.1 outer membrane protein [Helicobacter mehlei]
MLPKKSQQILLFSQNAKKAGAIFLLALPLGLQAEKNAGFIGVGLEIGRADKKLVGEKNGQIFQVPQGTVALSAANPPPSAYNPDGTLKDTGLNDCNPGNCKAEWTPGMMPSDNAKTLQGAENPGRNAPMFGLNVIAGYKQFFGKKRWFGLRYYGFFDYGHSNFSNATASNYTSVFFQNNDKVDMYTYGVGTDMLFNIINKPKLSVGLFLGAQFAGNTWTSNKVSRLKQGYLIGTVPGECAYVPDPSNVNPCASGYTPDPSVSVGTNGQINTASLVTTGPLTSRVTTTHFQFLVNVGIRANFIEHHGIEFGIKIPTIPLLYYKGVAQKYLTPNGKGVCDGPCEGYYTLSQTFRRQYSMYLRYIYSF